jgi:hypothetical protein
VPHGISLDEWKSINTFATKNQYHMSNKCPISFMKCKNAAKLFCECAWVEYLKTEIQPFGDRIVNNTIHVRHSMCVYTCSGSSMLRNQIDGYCRLCRERFLGKGLMWNFDIKSLYAYKCDHFSWNGKHGDIRKCVGLCPDCGKKKDCLVSLQRNLYRLKE